MAFKIRRVRRDEGKDILSIWRDSVEATHHFLSASDRQNIELEVGKFLPEAPLWVTVDDKDKPVAFMLLSEHHLKALFVAPEAQGMGVGRLLVAYALSLIPRLTLDVNEQNQAALTFYQKQGFVVTGRSEVDQQGRPYQYHWTINLK